MSAMSDLDVQLRPTQFDVEVVRYLRSCEVVRTWSDAFGAWHARVNLSSDGISGELFAAEWPRIRAKARRAIRREILARERGHKVELS